MAIVVDTTTQNYQSASSSTLTFAHTCTGADLLVVVVPESRAAAVNSVTYNGDAMTLAESQSYSTTWARVYYIVNPDAGANNVVVTYASAITYRQAGAASFSGVNTSDPVGATSKTSGSAQNKSLAITTEADNSLIIDCVGDLGNVHSPTAGQTHFAGQSSGQNRVGGYEIVGAAGVYTQTWSGSVGVANYSMVCVEFKVATATIALTGTITAATTEADIVAGGKTIILTITGDTWVAAGATFEAQRQNIINGLDSAQAEAAGWDAEVKAKIPVTDVVRTSDTVVTITLSAEAAYNITATETITATVPATALTLGVQVVATPTFTVSPVVTSAIKDIIGGGFILFPR